MIRVVVVDDEPPARRKLKHLLTDQDGFTIAGEAASGGEAIEVIHRERPDLIFLDIQLPDCTGFDILESLNAGNALQIIFVTAHDDFALKAFELHAVDYLLKPVEPSRFEKSIKRARGLFESGNAAQLATRMNELMSAFRREPNYARRLLIQENDRSLFLDVTRIDWIEAAKNYVCIHSGAQVFITRGSLESIAAKLEPASFRRVNRSQIVNARRIAEVRRWFHGDQKLRLQDGTELTWSRRYRLDSLEELERV
jgi:two-component system, LytTR family, response regulator